MTDQRELARDASAQAYSPKARRAFIAILVLVALAFTTAAVAGYLAWDAQRQQAESGTDLAAEVAAECASQPARPDLADLCHQANRVIREEPVPQQAQDPEVQEREIQDPELQQGERQQAERQNPENQRAERQQAERQNPENQQGELQQTETQDAEVQDGDPDDPEIQDEETQDPEIQEPEEQEPEIQEPENQEPEIQDPQDPAQTLTFRDFPAAGQTTTCTLDQASPPRNPNYDCAVA